MTPVRSRRQMIIWLAFLSTLSTANPGCASDAPVSPSPDEEHLMRLQVELDMRVEHGLQSALPQPMPPEQVELTEAMLYRRQVADKMAGRVQESIAPIAIAAALFAVDGPVDLLLSVVPFDRLGRVGEIAHQALRTRKHNRRSRKLIELQHRFEARLSHNEREFIRLAGALKASERQALKVIHQRTGSANLIQTLMRKHLENDADVGWIADKLQRGKFERAFVTRYTFDKDIVHDIDGYDAHIPWRTLQAVVDGRRVDPDERAALARKLAGLMGERAAHQIVSSPAFARAYLGAGDRVVSVRGMSYKRGMRGATGSIDIVAFTRHRQAVFAEVKNWSANTWDKSWNDVIAQLGRHDHGIAEILDTGHESRTLAAKVLFVSRRGFEAWEPNKANRLKRTVSKRGWRVKNIPSNDIKGFDAIIDDLR